MSTLSPAEQGFREAIAGGVMALIHKNAKENGTCSPVGKNA